MTLDPLFLHHLFTARPASDLARLEAAGGGAHDPAGGSSREAHAVRRVRP